VPTGSSLAARALDFAAAATRPRPVSRRLGVHFEQISRGRMERGGSLCRRPQTPCPGRLAGGGFPAMPGKIPLPDPPGSGKGVTRERGEMVTWGGPGGSPGGTSRGWRGGASPPHHRGCGAGSWWVSPGCPRFGDPRSGAGGGLGRRQQRSAAVLTVPSVPSASLAGRMGA